MLTHLTLNFVWKKKIKRKGERKSNYLNETGSKTRLTTITVHKLESAPNLYLNR